MKPGTSATNSSEPQRARPRQAILWGALVVGLVSAIVGATTLNPYVLVLSVILGLALGGALGAAIAFGPRNTG